MENEVITLVNELIDNLSNIIYDLSTISHSFYVQKFNY